MKDLKKQYPNPDPSETDAIVLGKITASCCLQKHTLDDASEREVPNENQCHNNNTCAVVGSGGYTSSAVLRGEHVSQRTGLRLQRWSRWSSHVLSKEH